MKIYTKSIIVAYSLIMYNSEEQIFTTIGKISSITSRKSCNFYIV